MLSRAGGTLGASGGAGRGMPSSWLQRPHSALGGQPPGELMDTADGRALVAGLVAQMQSGAYA